MVHCDYCNAPMLSITQVCPNCGREQPPYPPVLPGGGGKSYRGWASILFLIGLGLLALGIALFFSAPYNNVSAYVFGSPDSQPQYLQLFGTPITPGYGYVIFFGGIGLILWLWALVSYNRGNRIDKANAALLRSLARNGNGNGNGH
jgi:hypothetical protein